VQLAVDSFGGLDILFNNAGMLRDKSFAKMDMADFRLVVDVHLMGAANCCKAVWPHMQAQNYGRIVVTTSSSGLYGNFGQSNYGAAKLGIIGFMNTIKLEGQKNNNHINATNPADYQSLISNLQFSRIAGLPYAAIPIATAISLQGNYPMIYPRKETKTYGTKADIEGEYHQGETVLIIDDLATTGGSKFEAIEKLTSAGLVVKDIVVLIDRQSGAKESLNQAGFHLHAVLTISELLDYWEENGKVKKEKIEETRRFLYSS